MGTEVRNAAFEELQDYLFPCGHARIFLESVRGVVAVVVGEDKSGTYMHVDLEEMPNDTRNIPPGSLLEQIRWSSKDGLTVRGRVRLNLPNTA